MTGDKKQAILDNYINGNYSDVKKAIKRMSKLELLELIVYLQSGDGYSHGLMYHNVINSFRNMLES